VIWRAKKILDTMRAVETRYYVVAVLKPASAAMMSGGEITAKNHVSTFFTNCHNRGNVQNREHKFEENQELHFVNRDN